MDHGWLSQSEIAASLSLSRGQQLAFIDVVARPEPRIDDPLCEVKTCHFGDASSMNKRTCSSPWQAILPDGNLSSAPSSVSGDERLHRNPPEHLCRGPHRDKRNGRMTGGIVNGKDERGENGRMNVH